MKKKLISLLLFFVLAFSSVMMVSAEETLSEPTEWADALTQMSGADAISHIGDENAVFLDLRAAADYEAGHIKNTVSAPVCNADYSVPVSNRDAFVAQMAELQVAENDTTIYLSCYAGTFCVNYAADWLVDLCDVEVEQLVRVTGGTFGDTDLAAASVSTHLDYVLEQVESGKGFILDVRATDVYYTDGYIDDSLHAPLFNYVDGSNKVTDLNDELAENFNAFVEANKELFESKTAYILCNSGASGAKAAHTLLNEAGYTNVRTIENGAKGVKENAPELFVNQQYVTGNAAILAVDDVEDNTVVIDVRAVERYDVGHVKNVPSYPVFTVVDGANKVTNGYDDLAKAFLAKVEANADFFAGNDICLICNSGASGAKAATKLLMQAGYSNAKIYTVEGGAKGTETDSSIPENLRWVTGKQAVSVIDNADYVIIDVRAAEVYAKGHLKGSVSLPLFSVDAEGNTTAVASPYEDELSQAYLAYLNDNKEELSGKSIYILCNSGARGVTNAFAIAEKAGLVSNVYGIEGGAKGTSDDKAVPNNLRYVTAAYTLDVLNNDTTVVVDVRAAEAYAAGHIDCSISLPLFAIQEDGSTVPTSLDDNMAEYFLAYVKDNAGYFEGKNIYILCNSGARGVVNAFALADKAGLANVYGIEGGAKNESLKAIFVTEEPAVGTPSLSYKKATYNGKVKLPKLTVVDANGNALVEGTDYVYVIYNADGKKVTKSAKVSTYTVRVTYRGEYIANKQAVLTYSIVPKAVTNLKAKLTGYNDVKLSWTKSTGATGYYVYYKKASAKSYTTANRKAVTKANVTFKDLADGTKYNFKVVPYYGAKKVTSLKYTTVTKTTLKKVTGVKVTRSGKNVKVKWTNINGETGYQISRSTKKSGTANVKTYKGSDLKSKSITLSKSSKYYYKVRAYKVEDGKKIYGPWSAVVYK